jgi:hypothetical protein
MGAAMLPKMAVWDFTQFCVRIEFPVSRDRSPCGLFHRAALTAAALCLAAVGLLGCAQVSPAAGGAPSLPLPYSLGIFYDAAGGREPIGELGDSAVRLDLSRERLLKTVADALEIEYGVVAHTRILPARNLGEALVAGEDLDFLMAVNLRAPPAYRRYSRPFATSALEIVAWLFGGVPAWFVPSVRYATEAELVVQVLDRSGSEARAWEVSRKDREAAAPTPGFGFGMRIDSPAQSLSLWERSSLTKRPEDYLLTIVAPPMFVVPGDLRQASASLTEKVSADFTAQLAEALANRFSEDESNLDLRVTDFEVVSDPASGSARVRFRLWSRAPATLAALATLEVRWAGASGAPTAWIAGAGALRGWNEALRAAPGGAIDVDVPQDVAIKPGPNLVQVRLLLLDGGFLSRTAVLEGPEAGG